MPQIYYIIQIHIGDCARCHDAGCGNLLHVILRKCREVSAKSLLGYSRLAQLGAYAAKSEKTWRTTITLFLAIGLIWRKIPTVVTAKTPYEQAAVRYMMEQGNQYAVGFYTFPEYTARQLRYCEHKVNLWYSNDGNLQDWSKSSVIDVLAPRPQTECMMTKGGNRNTNRMPRMHS